MMIALRILLLLLLFIFAGYSLTISAAQDATGGHGLNVIGGVKENGLSIIRVHDDYEDFLKSKDANLINKGISKNGYVAFATSVFGHVLHVQFQCIKRFRPLKLPQF